VGLGMNREAMRRALSEQHREAEDPGVCSKSPYNRHSPARRAAVCMRRCCDIRATASGMALGMAKRWLRLCQIGLLPTADVIR
jgi:hypothetical protein